jgi:hypothetical protein
MSVKRQFESAAADVLRELERCSPGLLAAIIEETMRDKDCTRDEAIRWLAEFETTLKQLLEASQSIGEA